MEKEINDTIKLIIDNLSDDLLKPKYRLLKKRNKFTGHCYVATETLYHLLPEEIKNEYKPHTVKINNDTHWFLKNMIDSTIIDITKKQFNFDINYNSARQNAFLTKSPSKRSLILINRIYEKINN